MKKVEIVFVAGLVAVMLVGLLLSTAAQPVSAQFPSGSGTPEDPYIIENVEQLQEMNDNLEAHYALGNDIDASATRYWNDENGFIPIGYYDADWNDYPFTGSFDGRGYKISNLWENWVEASGIFIGGLFGVAKNAVIENVGLENVYINIEHSEWGGAGALAGELNVSSVVSNCYSTGIVIGFGFLAEAGGLVGNCYVTNISNSYSTSSVSGENYVGGLVGKLLNAGGTAIVSNCYSVGFVTSYYSEVGGLVGGGDGTVSNSFWDNETSGQSTSAGGTGKTTENMKKVRTFTDNTWSEGLDTPWDFVGNPYEDENNEDIWNINPSNNNGYPFLSWQLAGPPFFIDGNDDFVPANGVNGGGSGAEEDPYIIENWVIDSSGANGIHIENTTTHFIIRNCLVENGGNIYNGIYIDNAVNGRIENNTCENNNRGIFLEDSSDNNIIATNLCENNDDAGIRLHNSDNNIIENNVSNNNQYGITLSSSDSNAVRNNVFENNDEGIYMVAADTCVIDNNVCRYNNFEGIDVLSSTYNNIINNLSDNNRIGVLLWTSDSNIVENNICSNNDWRGIDLFSSESNAIINNVCDNNIYYGILVYDSCNYCSVENNTCDNNGDGIYVFNSILDNIRNNVCDNNNNNGIWLETADNCIIENNTCNNNIKRGIYSYNSDNNTLSGNTCHGNNYEGILFLLIDNTSLSNSSCYGNTYEGIAVYNSNNNTFTGNNSCGNDFDGIYLDNSDNNSIMNNTFENNIGEGIWLSSSDNNLIENNTCENNDYGIYIDTSGNNIIILNYLINNTTNNAFNDGANAWDNNGEGNYWDDWQPFYHLDADNDGVVDEPRPIEGNTNQDNYPLVFIIVTISIGKTDPTYIESITVQGTVTIKGEPADISSATLHDSIMGDRACLISGNTFSLTYEVPNEVGHTAAIYVTGTGSNWRSDTVSYTIMPIGGGLPIFPPQTTTTTTTTAPTTMLPPPEVPEVPLWVWAGVACAVAVVIIVATHKVKSGSG